MNTRDGVLHVRQFLKKVDWKLLVFLLLLLNVKLVIKLAAILMVYAWRFNFKFGYSFKNSRLPVFYPAIILIAVLNAFVFNRTEDPNYIFSFITGLGFWMACILGGHQLKLFVEKNSTEVITSTLTLFFLTNCIFSAGTLLLIILKTGSWNPYTYQGEFQKYFISTGDFIKGITFDTSTTNAVLNAFAVLFFYFKRNFVLLFICLCTLLLTASNMVNLLLLITFLYLFIFRSDRNQKSILLVCCFLFVVFLVKISPQNNQYINDTVSRMANSKHQVITNQKNIPAITALTDSSLSAEDSRKVFARRYLDSVNKINLSRLENNSENHDREATTTLLLWQEKPLLPTANIHSAPYQHKDDPDAHKELVAFVSTHELPADTLVKQKQIPGKLLAHGQTIHYLNSKKYSLVGTGMGHFSSKLAFKTTGLNIAGGYPKKYIYIDPGFEKNHLALYLSFFSSQERYHSFINSPNSVYDQLLAEYGLAGIAALLFFYFGFFMKYRRVLTYGIPLLLMTAGLFFVDYWFEQLSIVFILELLLFLNTREEGHVH
jgi:hypothetical protein